jgi:ribosome-binding factor A
MSQRLNRMADQVQRELADLIRMEIKDPRLGGLVTISSVKISPDLGYADIYVTVMGRELGDDQTETAHHASLEVLRGAAGFLRAELGRRIKTRFTPRLRFHYDTVTAHGNYMTQLISKAMSDVSPETDQPDPS